MRTFKIIGLILLAMVAAIFIWAAVLPSAFVVEKCTYIKSNRMTIYESIADFREWKHWSPWHDSTTRISYSGEECGVGAKMSWQNNQMAVGEMSIEACHPDSFVLVKLKALETLDSSYIRFQFKDYIDSIKVSIIYASEDHDYFLGRFEGFIMRTAMEESSEIGLKDMKEYVENKPEAPEDYGFEVEEGDMPQRYYMGIRDSFHYQDMDEFMYNLRTRVDKQVAESGIEVLGAPIMLWEPTRKMTAVRYAYPVAEGSTIPNGLQAFHLPAYEIIKVRMDGNYQAQNAAWISLQQHMENKGLSSRHFAFEEFVRGAHNEADTAKWITYRVYPVYKIESNE